MSQVGSVCGLQELLDDILFQWLKITNIETGVDHLYVAKRNGGTQNSPAKWTNGGTAQRIAKLMKKYIEALQFYWSISLYIMLISPVAAVCSLLCEPVFYRDNARPRAPS